MPVQTRFRLVVRKGNTKLGRRVLTFSLPAARSCPGRSALCEKSCYALRGHFVMPGPRAMFQRNLRASRRPGFGRRLAREILTSGAQLVRLHVSGDIYSARYCAQLRVCARLCPDKTFLLYTRSWRVPEIYAELVKLARLRNVRLWFSADKETGLPPRLPRRVRVAWMAVSESDPVPPGVDLVFLDYNMRRKVRKRAGGALVCVKENGTHAQTTCAQCRLCWASLEQEPHMDPRRFALPLVAS